MTSSSENQNSAVLLVLLIPLVLGLQMAALWVMANASSPDTSVAAQASASPSPTVSNGTMGAVLTAQQAPSNPPLGPSTPALSAATAAPGAISDAPASPTIAPTDADNSIPWPETDLASNVMIPVALQPTPESEPVQTAPQDTTLASPPETVTEAADAGTVDQSPGLKASTWLQSRASEHYTLQVERFSDLVSLQAFAEQMTLPQPQAYYRQNTGRTWYVLVAGEYADQQTALRIAAELTSQHAAIKPWVRPFQEIQAQLP